MSSNRKLHQFTRPIVLLLILFLVTSVRVNGQETNADSLFSAKLMEDNLQLFHRSDSLEEVISLLRNKNTFLTEQVDSLLVVVNLAEQKRTGLKMENDSLSAQYYSLNRTILQNKQEILRLNTELQQAAQQLRDKEFQLARTELELKELNSNAELNKVKLEGKLDVHSTKLEAKDTEIAFLKNSIKEKDAIIAEKTRELSGYYSEKENSLRIIDSLARALNQKELDYVKISERLKIIEAEYNAMQAKQTAAANKKKKIRFIQGVGIKNYRTPDWQLAPKSSSSSSELVISNKNAGKMDVDYITGVSLSLYDLTKDDSKFTYDAGIFVGFGGQNLFKNFYIGPSFKVLDFFHINTGANFAEYQQLKPGFSEGDKPGESGLSSVLVKQWKTNFFIGFTLDLELLSTIPKKF